MIGQVAVGVKTNEVPILIKMLDRLRITGNASPQTRSRPHATPPSTSPTVAQTTSSR